MNKLFLRPFNNEYNLGPGNYELNYFAFGGIYNPKYHKFNEDVIFDSKIKIEVYEIDQVLHGNGD